MSCDPLQECDAEVREGFLSVCCLLQVTLNLDLVFTNNWRLRCWPLIQFRHGFLMLDIENPKNVTKLWIFRQKNALPRALLFLYRNSFIFCCFRLFYFSFMHVYFDLQKLFFFVLETREPFFFVLESREPFCSHSKNFLSIKLKKYFFLTSFFLSLVHVTFSFQGKPSLRAVRPIGHWHQEELYTWASLKVLWPFVFCFSRPLLLTNLHAGKILLWVATRPLNSATR